MEVWGFWGWRWGRGEGGRGREGEGDGGWVVGGWWGVMGGW